MQYFNWNQNRPQTGKLSRVMLVMLTLVICVAGCKKFVQVEPPRSLLLGDLVFEEYGTALAAISGVYMQLRSESSGLLHGGNQGMSAYLAQFSDEILSYSNQNATFGENFYKSVLFPDSDDIYALWTTAYNQIYYVNAIIEGLNRSTRLSVAQKDQIMGEALFIRAILYFYLVNLYGDVPYIDTTAYLVNKNMARMPAETVYAKLLADLEMAEQLLGDDYPSAERVRVNKYAARALMARVYLYQQNWPKAEVMATSVIGNTDLYQWVDDLNQVFLKESTSTIWAFKPIREGVNAEEGNTYIVRSSPLSYGLVINAPLLHAFEPGDLRRGHWVGSYSEDASTWYFPNKYKIAGIVSFSEEYSVILRLEEQYLIRAEARAEQENISGAQEDLNMLRTRAGLLDTEADSKQTLRVAILHERQVELFTEFGHRWFDLKRLGQLDEVMSPLKPNWDAADHLLPVPEKELLVNPSLLPQNPGY